MAADLIRSVRGRRVWDSRGRPTIEVEIELQGGEIGRSIAPSGASIGSKEAFECRDGGPLLGGLGVRKAVSNVNGPIQDGLRGSSVINQIGLDARLRDLDNQSDVGCLGANALIATSTAAAQAAANLLRKPLYQHLGLAQRRRLPLPEIQIFGGGAHSTNSGFVQDYMITCAGAQSISESLECTAEVFSEVGRVLKLKGLWCGFGDEGGYCNPFRRPSEVLELLTRSIEKALSGAGRTTFICLDVAASNFGTAGSYAPDSDNASVTTEVMIDMMAEWIRDYPVISIEDPLAENDWAGFRSMTLRSKGLCHIVGDDLTATSDREISAAATSEALTGVVIKPNQVGTLTEAHAAFEAARCAGLMTVVSARSGETEDCSIAHLAAAWGADQLKVGALSKSDRVAKWNECIRIEEALGSEAILAKPFAGLRGC